MAVNIEEVLLQIIQTSGMPVAAYRDNFVFRSYESVVSDTSIRNKTSSGSAADRRFIRNFSAKRGEVTKITPSAER